VAHQSLYRKYRPQTFEDVVGQTHITRTLRNAVAEGAVAHAYLFTGPRGTGKTTTARILAKALNCEKGPTPEPDITCDECIDIAEGRHPDVYELDAASRTGVDNVREEIIGRLMYPATRGGYKVYIIDEVHMLSTGAFNALLKSIEEPPSQTVFVLCTTHPQKVPETIHSRCQRFDFHRIGIEDLVGRLALICKQEEIQVAEGALTLVAKHAMGGMRDAIATLEQLSTFTGKQIALDDVEGLLGEVDTGLLVELADLIAQRDIAGCFRFVERLVESGNDLTEFVRDLTGHMRDLFVTASVGDPTGIVDATQEHLARLSSQAALFGADRLARILDLLGDLGSQIRWASDSRITLEVALTRMARPEADLTLEALAERVSALESAVRTGDLATPPAAATSADAKRPTAKPAKSVKAAEAAKAAKQVESADSAAASAGEKPGAEAPKPAREEPTVIEAPARGPLDRAAVKRAWPAVLAEIKKQKAARASLFDGTEVDVDGDGVTLVVEFPLDQRFSMQKAQEASTAQLLRSALATVLGSPPPFRQQLGRGPVRRETAQTELRRTDVPPATVADETETREEAASAASGDTTPDDIEHLLINELGAEKVAEHKHDTPEERIDE